MPWVLNDSDEVIGAQKKALAEQADECGVVRREKTSGRENEG